MMHSPLILRELRLTDQEALMAALEEPWEKDFVFAHYFDSVVESAFDQYVKILPEIAQGKHIPAEHVASTLLFAFVGSKIVGRVSIRHTLNAHLTKTGGHVGYGVVPSERRKGYASEILRQTLPYIRQKIPQLKRVLLTCDDTNEGSIKTIEKNGGKLENVYKTPEMAVGKRRYWIDL